MEREKIVFHQSDWFAILLLVVFPPVGIFLMWKKRKFTRTIRIVASLLTGVLFIFFWTFVLYAGMWLYLFHAFMPGLPAFQ